jgi:hypothetical protein
VLVALPHRLKAMQKPVRLLRQTNTLHDWANTRGQCLLSVNLSKLIVNPHECNMQI